VLLHEVFAASNMGIACSTSLLVFRELLS
jgi:hypothetical protein